jgi:arylsulfatase A-like enzyme
VLAFSAYGKAAGAIAAGTRALPADLADVTPTLLDLLNVPPPNRSFDGLSLAAELRSLAADSGQANRARFTETGFNIPHMLAGNLDPRVAAMEGASYYSVNPVTGYLELKKSSIAYVQDLKERAVIAGPWLLAAMPDGKLGFNYVLARRDGTDTKLVESQADHPVLASLWRSLSEKYGAEVGSLPKGAVRHQREPRG